MRNMSSLLECIKLLLLKYVQWDYFPLNFQTPWSMYFILFFNLHLGKIPFQAALSGYEMRKYE